MSKQEFLAAAGDQLEIKELKREAAARDRRIEELTKKCDLLTSLDSVTADPPTWLRAPSGPHNHIGIANLMLSDLHLDEIVIPAQMSGVNAYNRKIASYRLETTIHNTIDITPRTTSPATTTRASHALARRGRPCSPATSTRSRGKQTNG